MWCKELAILFHGMGPIPASLTQGYEGMKLSCLQSWKPRPSIELHVVVLMAQQSGGWADPSRAIYACASPDTGIVHSLAAFRAQTSKRARHSGLVELGAVGHEHMRSCANTPYVLLAGTCCQILQGGRILPLRTLASRWLHASPPSTIAERQ